MIFPQLILKIERWKFNKDYGVYVSTLGHFKDRHKRLLPIKVNQHGYCAVNTERGQIFAHRLVMFTWRPIPNAEILTVDHLNHNKRDNSLENLEWVTREENVRRAENDFIPSPYVNIHAEKWSNEDFARRHYFINKTTGEYFENGFEAVKWWNLTVLKNEITDSEALSSAKKLVTAIKKDGRYGNYEWEAILNPNLVN